MVPPGLLMILHATPFHDPLLSLYNKAHVTRVNFCCNLQYNFVTGQCYLESSHRKMWPHSTLLTLSFCTYNMLLKGNGNKI